MNIISKLKKYYLAILFILFSTVGCAFSPVVLSQTKDYKLDRIAYSINDYNNHIHSNGMVAPAITIERKEQKIVNQKSYADLYRQYYYGFMTTYIMNMSSNKMNDIFNNQIRFHTQSTFSIYSGKDSNGLYNLENNLFKVYYKDELLGDRGYLKTRYDCPTFVFISDTYADYLLKKYSLNSYDELILNEKACILEYIGEDGNTYKACINNIISSKYASGRYTVYDCNYFSLIYLNQSINNSIRISFKIGFKGSPYCIKDVLQKIEAFGYNSKDYNILIQTADYSTRTLVNNEIVTENYIDAMAYDDSSFKTLTYVVFIVTAIGSLITLYLLFSKNRKLFLIISAIFTTIFLIIFLIFVFQYSYHFFYLIPVLIETMMIILSLILATKKLRKKQIIDEFTSIVT